MIHCGWAMVMGHARCGTKVTYHGDNRSTHDLDEITCEKCLNVLWEEANDEVKVRRGKLTAAVNQLDEISARLRTIAPRGPLASS